MNNSQVNFIHALIEAVPDLRAVYLEHLKDNDEILPHVLMADFTRYIIGNVSSAAANQEELQRLLERFEAAVSSGDAALENLVAVSFVENLSGEDEALKILADRVGPTLRREIKSICGF